MGYPIKQNQTAQPLEFLMIDSTDHINGKTGLTPTVTISKNGGAFAPPSGAVSEIGNGWYKVAGNSADASALGPLLLHASSAGADPADDRFDVVAYDPQVSPPTAATIRAEMDANSTKLANLDATISSRSTFSGGTVSGVTGNVVGSVGSVAAPVTVGTNNDKTGYTLASTGLDAIPITAPTGLASTFPQMIVQTWRRFFKKATRTTTQIKTYADDGTTAVTTQTITDDGAGNETQGAAS